MALGAALTDEARIVRKAKGERVEGTMQATPVELEWFKARLELPSEDEASEDSGRRRHQVLPSLMLKSRDKKGQRIAVFATDQVWVKSNQITEQTGGKEDEWLFEVKGRPQPIRKRRAVIGYVCNLVKVEATDKRA